MSRHTAPSSARVPAGAVRAMSLWDTVAAPARALTRRTPRGSRSSSSPQDRPVTRVAESSPVGGAVRTRKLKPGEWTRPDWNPATRLVVEGRPGEEWALRQGWDCGAQVAGVLLVAYERRADTYAPMPGFYLESVRVVIE